MRKLLFLFFIPLLWGCYSSNDNSSSVVAYNLEYNFREILSNYNITGSYSEFGTRKNNTLATMSYLEDNSLSILVFDPKGERIVKDEHLILTLEDEIQNGKINLGDGSSVDFKPNFVESMYLDKTDDTSLLVLSFFTEKDKDIPQKYNMYFFDQNGIIKKTSQTIANSYDKLTIKKIEQGYYTNNTVESPSPSYKYQYTFFNKNGEPINTVNRQEVIKNDIRFITDKEIVATTITGVKATIDILDNEDKAKDKQFEFSMTEDEKDYPLKEATLTLKDNLLTFKCVFIGEEEKVIDFEKQIDLNTREIVE